jgi:UPF0755 protein
LNTPPATPDNSKAAPAQHAPETTAVEETTPFDVFASAPPNASASPIAAASSDDPALRQAQKAARQKAVRKVKRSRGTKVLILVALLLLGAMAMVKRKRDQEQRWRWASIVMPERSARVPEEWTPPELAERLKASRKIRHEGTFLEAARAVKLEAVEPGGYQLPAKATPLQLAQLFKEGPTLEKVTFPEGFTASRIADRLAARGFSSAPELKRLAYPPGSRVSPIEGRWFPETYWLPRNGTAPEIAKILQERHREVLAKLPKPYPIGAGGKRLSEAEVVTLASIVERESRSNEERPVVAGVLLNRLKKGMPLQCDATVQYALERARESGQLASGRKEQLLYRDIDAVADSPYNTYKIAGLPPGPICSPGQRSLEAAARPKSHDYLYYVMSPALGEHRFSSDYSEFLRHKRQYKRELAEE